MEIKYGAIVVDKNGNNLGTVDYIIRDSWTGELKKFVVRRKAPDNDLFLAPADVLETNKSMVKMNLPLEQLEKL